MLDGSASSGVLDAEDIRDGIASNGVAKHDGSRRVAARQNLCGERTHTGTLQGGIGCW